MLQGGRGQAACRGRWAGGRGCRQHGGPARRAGALAHPSMLPLPPAAENLAIVEATSLVASCAPRPLTPCLQAGGGAGGSRQHEGAVGSTQSEAVIRTWSARSWASPENPGVPAGASSRLDQQVSAILGSEHKGQAQARHRHFDRASLIGLEVRAEVLALKAWQGGRPSGEGVGGLGRRIQLPHCDLTLANASGQVQGGNGGWRAACGALSQCCVLCSVSQTLQSTCEKVCMIVIYADTSLKPHRPTIHLPAPAPVLTRAPACSNCLHLP